MSEGLKSPDWHERRRAALALGSSQDHAGAVRTLEAVLRQDPARGVRTEAAFTLGQLGGPDATAVLVEKAASTDEPIVRTAALVAIETSLQRRLWTDPPRGAFVSQCGVAVGAAAALS